MAITLAAGEARDLSVEMVPIVAPPPPLARIINLYYATASVTYTYDPMPPAGIVYDGMTVPLGPGGRLYISCSWENLSDKTILAQFGLRWMGDTPYGPRERYSGAWVGTLNPGENFMPAVRNHYTPILVSAFPEFAEGQLVKVEALLQYWPNKTPILLDSRIISIRV